MADVEGRDGASAQALVFGQRRYARRPQVGEAGFVAEGGGRRASRPEHFSGQGLVVGERRVVR